MQQDRGRQTSRSSIPAALWLRAARREPAWRHLPRRSSPEPVRYPFPEQAERGQRLWWRRLFIPRRERWAFPGFDSDACGGCGMRI